MSYLYMGTIVPLSIAVPVAVGVIKYKTLDSPLKIALLFLLMNGLTNVLAKLLSVAKLRNLPLLHLYTVAELTVLLFFYRSILNDTRLSKWIPAVIAGFLGLSVINTCFFQSIFTYNSYTRTLEAILIMFFSIAYFIKLLDKIDQPTGSGAIAIINAALLLYFSGAFILFIISNVVATDVVLGTAIWNVHATLVLLMYVLFAIALWKHRP
jgi:hypothetical protein